MLSLWGVVCVSFEEKSEIAPFWDKAVEKVKQCEFFEMHSMCWAKFTLAVQ